MIELIEQTERTVASDAYLAALAEENAMLRERAQRAEAERDILAETSAELATDFIQATRWAHTWKQTAKEHWKNATLSMGTIERSIEFPVTERAEMAQARYVIRELMNLIEGWEHLPACPAWLQDEAEQLTAGVEAGEGE